jgi:glycosyltransferase involved in cell wall biosynthesis
MKLKNVLIICPFFRPNIGGVETHLDLLTQYLSTHNYKTTVLTYKPITTKTKDYLKVEKTKNLTIYRYWWFGQNIFDKTTPYPFLQFLYIVPGLLFHTFIYLSKNHTKIDTIHAHGFAAGFIVSFCQIFFKIKNLVISTHYIYPNLNPQKISTKILKWTFSKFNKILTVSQTSAQQLINIGLNPNQMTIYKHWLDPKIYSTKTKTNKKFNILFVGRIIKMKGVFNLLKVAKTLPKIEFNLIGNGPDYKSLFLISKNQKNFHLLGKMKPTDIVYYYHQASLTILPSITPEAQPMVIMESLMCGTPVICTNLGSASKMYNSKVGITINPTTKNIYSKIKYFYQNQNILNEYQKNSRSFALKNYSPQNAKKIIQTYI